HEVCCFAGVRELTFFATNTDIFKYLVNKSQVDDCGISNVNGLNSNSVRNVEGQSKFGEYPWVVQVCKTNCATEPQSSGSLVAPNVVVTIAHIVVNSSAEQLLVRAGEWNTKTVNEPYAHQDRDVKSVHIHPDFQNSGKYFDIAVLVLKSNFELSPHIGTICLPPAGVSFDNSRCFVAGWGKKDMYDLEYSHILKKIAVSVVDRETCQVQLRRTSFSKYFILHHSFVCAGGEKDNSICVGDGGSPLMCPLDNSSGRYQLAGVVAFGAGCNAENVPAVYINVPMVRDWI
ncbi:hypothetical protein KR222_006700, partial [Zaprionus bogoriensis]